MNLQSAVISNSIGFLLIIILFISSHLVRNRNHAADRCFTILMSLVAFACVTETFSAAIEGRKEPTMISLNYMAVTVLYALNLLCSLFWCIYVDLRLYNSKEHILKYIKFVFIPAVIAVCALIPNLLFGYLFSIDEKGVYHRHFLLYLFYILEVVYGLLSIADLVVYYNRKGKVKFFPIYMFIAPVIVGTSIQTIYPKISLAWCSVAIGLVAIYMSLQNELSYLDPLTKLYNRNFLNHKLSEIMSKKILIGGIMIDIDYFKNINDQFGHAVGDEALEDAADIISSALPPKGIPIRFAGDEFIVIVKAEKEKTVRETVDSIRHELSEFNKNSEKQYELSFSIGYSMFDPRKGNSDTFFNDMDAKMYEEKRLKHSRSSQTPRKIEVVIHKPANINEEILSHHIR